MTGDSHICARCDGEGFLRLWGTARVDVDCGACHGEGDCHGPTDSGTGECIYCGWSYDGPRETPESGPADSLRPDMIDRQRRPQ